MSAAKRPIYQQRIIACSACGAVVGQCDHRQLVVMSKARAAAIAIRHTLTELDDYKRKAAGDNGQD